MDHEVGFFLCNRTCLSITYRLQQGSPGDLDASLHGAISFFWNFTLLFQ